MPVSLLRSRQRALSIAVAAALGTSAPAWATDIWDNSSGNGSWSTATNWQDNTEPTINDDVDLPAGFPGPSPGTVTTINLSANEVAASVRFEDSYTLGGGNLSSGGSGTVNVNLNTTGTINSVLAGITGLTKIGGGTLILGGINSFSGSVSIGGGPVQINSDACFGNSSNAVSIDGSTLAVVGVVSSARTYTLGSSGATITVDPISTMSLSTGFMSAFAAN